MEQKIILLVEDNPDDVALTLRAFKRCKIANTVIVAQDGVEALDYLLGGGVYSWRDPCQLPHLILLDLKLPKLNGIEVLKQIRTLDHTKHIPVIMLSTSTEEQDVMSAYKSGCNSYVRKPVDFIEFMELVQQMGLYWLVWNQNPELQKSNHTLLESSL